MTEFLLYTGCAIPTKLPFIEAATRFILKVLDIKHKDFPEFTCCVEPAGLRSLGLETWLVSGARIHAIGKRYGAPILTLCDGCNLSLRESAEILDSGHKKNVDSVLKEIGYVYEEGVKVVGLTELLHSRLEDLREKSVRRTDLRLGIHPGCHSIHLAMKEGYDAEEIFTDIVETLGGKAKRSEKRTCCGGSLISVNDTVAKGVSGEAINSYEGSDAIITSCPFCFMQFDTVMRRVPVIHIAELVAYCLGWDIDPLTYHHTKLKGYEGKTAAMGQNE
ncbi:MAG: heterodisulfide reductase subunit [Candidatus Methanomethylophilaceae archaeon]|nr:heterodisulfide reductase subunit [Candidatus Methanomethylophilaceae archaeon]HIJ00568.1 hypothetical protein [Candidatus Methanomethylophilaceae archaeon]